MMKSLLSGKETQIIHRHLFLIMSFQFASQLPDIRSIYSGIGWEFNHHFRAPGPSPGPTEYRYQQLSSNSSYPLPAFPYLLFLLTFQVLFLCLKFFHWNIADLQRCVNFRCIAKWISYTYTYILFLRMLFPYRSL